MHAKQQVELLAKFIMTEVPGEPSMSEGAVDCAIRTIRALQAKNTELQADLSVGVASFELAAKRIIELEAELLKSKDLYKSLVNDMTDEMECLPGCDSYGHEEFCPVTNPVAAWRQLRAELQKERERRDINHEGIDPALLEDI